MPDGTRPTLDAEQVDAADIAEIEKLQPGERLTRDVPVVAYGYGRYAPLMFGGAEAFTRGANPDLIGWDTLDRMRRHGIIKAGLTLIKAPILSRANKANVVCDDPAIKATVEKVFLDSGLYYRLVRQCLKSMDFGVSFNEKVWDVEDITIEYETTDDDTQEKSTGIAWEGPMHTYKDIVEVNPATVSRILRRDGTAIDGMIVSPPAKNAKPNDGSYNGFVQTPIGAESEPRTVDAARSFVYANDEEFGNLWGWPRQREAYPFYFWQQVILKLWMAYAEKQVVPPRIGRAPIGKDVVSAMDNMQVMLQVLNMLDSATGVVLPSTNVGGASKIIGGRGVQNDWDISELATKDVNDVFQKIVEYLDTAMLRAMFVPERTFTQGDAGTYAMADAHLDTFLLTEDASIFDIAHAITRYVIAVFVLLNFGSGAASCRIDMPGLSDDERGFLAQIFTALMSNATLQARVNLDKLAERFNVPLNDVTDDEGVNSAAQPAGEPPAAADAGAVPADTGTAAEPPTAEPDAATGAPANLALDDVELAVLDAFAIALVDAFDAQRYDVTPDSTSVLGYKVIDKHNGKRLTGFSAAQVLKAYQASAKKGATAAAAAAKKQQSVAAAAQRKADAAAAKAKREQTTAASRAAAEAKREAAKQTAAAKAAQRDHDKAARAAQQHDKQAAAAAHKQATQQAAAQKKQETAQTAAQKQTEAAQIAQTKLDRTALEATTKQQAVAQATQTLKAKGYTVDASAPDRASAIEAATQAASNDPNSIYTVVQVKGAFVVASKPKSAIITKAQPGNIAASDVRLAEGHDAVAPDEATKKLFAEAERRLLSLFAKAA